MKTEVELADLHAFVAVVESGGFTQAARRMGTTKSVLSRRISVLEQRLGTMLLERLPRGSRTTEVGAVYYAKCVRILESVDAAGDFVASFHDLIRGRLRVALSDEILAHRLAPCLHEFAATHRQIVLDLIVCNPALDEGQDPDIAIRLIRGNEADLVPLALRDCEEILVASPSYLATFGTPSSAKALLEHDGLLDDWRDTRGGWDLIEDNQRQLFLIRERMRSASAARLIGAAEAGLGITLQPDYLVDDAIEAGRLVRVLPEHAGARRTLAALYTPSRRKSKKVRALLTFLGAHFGAAFPAQAPA